MLENVYKFNSKELDAQTGYYYYGARYYDPGTSVFLSVDPLAEQFSGWTPYHYVHNNPINLIDPTGMSAEVRDDDYTIGKNGDLNLIRETDDNFDRILQTDNKGEIKTRGNGFLTPKDKRGTEKVAVDNIAKGILQDGLNLKENDEIFLLNGEGQPSLEEFNKFISQFSDYIGKEIAGVKLGKENSNDIDKVMTFKYKNNTKYESGTPDSWFKMKALKGHFHTHPYGDHTPSDLDHQTKAKYPKVFFSIIAGGYERSF